MRAPFFTVSLSRVFSAALLVAGTCVGGGMLAQPVVNALTGFWPSVCMLLVCWAAMTLTGIMLVEVALALGSEVHLISMSRQLLGPLGAAISWLLYLFISYASLVAYTAAGGALFKGIFLSLGFEMSKNMGCALFVLLFGSTVVAGNRWVGSINAFLFIAAIVAYFALVGTSFDQVRYAFLERSHWPLAPLSIPILLTSFSFQTMVPSLTPYLNGDRRALICSVILGTTIALVCYLVWLALVLGIVPLQGEGGLIFAIKEALPATEPLKLWVSNRWIGYLAELFAFFALVTSFLGIALGLYDFLADGLQVAKRGWRRLFLGVVAFLPTLLFAIFYKEAFLMALETTGGFGDTILNGIFPALMIAVLRQRGIYSKISAWPLLLATILFYTFSFGLEVLAHSGHVLPIYDAQRAIDYEAQLMSGG